MRVSLAVVSVKEACANCVSATDTARVQDAGVNHWREADKDTMNLDKLKEKLGDETFAELKTHIDDLTGQRDAARNESIEGRKKLKAEVEALRAVKATLYEKLGLDESADINDLPEIKGQAEIAKQFEQRLKRLEREKADALQKASDVEGQWKSSRLEAALGKAMSAHDFVDSELVASFIGSRVQWEDDRIMVKEGDKLMALDDGVKWLAQTKPHLIKAAGKTGSGQPPGAGGEGGQKNPWAKESRNLTEQIALSKANPALAAQLKAAAGA